MTARAALFSLINEDPGVLAAGVEEVYATMTLDTPAEDLFVVIRWTGSQVVAYKTRSTERVEVWVHDRNQDYSRIDTVLRTVRSLLLPVTQRVGDDGWVLTTAEWNGCSPDLVDGGFHTQTRYDTYTVVSRYNEP